MEIKKNPTIRFKTSKGNIDCELFEDKVPNTVANIIELAENNFFKGMSFHRVIKDFMAQGGCPHSKDDSSGMAGTGGPKYKFADEFHADLKHTKRGILSMANAGPNTNGSQFFMCFVPCKYLDKKHAVFGEVISGFDVLDELEKIGSQSGRPKEKVYFDIEILSKNDHAYNVQKI